MTITLLVLRRGVRGRNHFARASAPGQFDLLAVAPTRNEALSLCVGCVSFACANPGRSA